MGLGSVGDTDLLFIPRVANNTYEAEFLGSSETSPFGFITAKDPNMKTLIEGRIINIPVVNVTEIEEVLDQVIEDDQGNNVSIKNAIGIEGLYARWMAVAKLSRL